MNLELMPWYMGRLAMGYEYVTRAYDTLRMAENADVSVGQMFDREKKHGFAHITDVYVLAAKNA